MRFARTLLVTVIALLAPAAPAQADHHFVKIVEVFNGTAAQPNAEFVEVRAHAVGQNILTGRSLRVYDATGAVITTATFTANVASGANQMTFLVGTSQAASYFGVTPDLLMPASIPAAGGKVCWVSNTLGILDCVSWGTFSGLDTGHGEASPVNPTGGIPAGMSLLRDISGGTDPNTLQAADDTNNSSFDFDVVPVATPRNNAGATTTKAGAVSASDGSLTFDSDVAALVNRVTVQSLAGGTKRVLDKAAPVVAGAGCNQVTVDTADCPATTGGELRAGPGNDFLTVAGTMAAQLFGEDGADTLNGAGGAETLEGGAQGDTLSGNSGADTLLGGDGNDSLSGGFGPDSLDGGAGVDTATWSARGEGVTVDIDAESDDGSGNDGPAGARDTTLATIENLTGGRAADTLTGSPGNNVFNGGLGSDTISGGLGTNTITYAVRTSPVQVDLVGQTGGDPAIPESDSLTGIQNIVGGAGADSLAGDALNNQITGGKGQDTITAGNGNDIVLVRDSFAPDSADCGVGSDRFTADAGDALTDCESPL